MLARLRPRLTYANVVATLALFVALGGGAYAAATIGPGDIQDNAVRSNHIKDGEVKNQDLANDSVGTAKIRAGGVQNSDLADSSVDSAKVADGSLTSADLANLAVGTPQLQDLSVVGAKLADGAVGASKLAAGAVGAAQLADGAVTSSKLGIFSVDGIKVRTAGIGSRAIQNGSITGADIGVGAIGDQQLDVQPGASVIANGQTIATSNKCATVIYQDHPEFDNGGLYSPASTSTSKSQLVIPKAGIYLVTALVGWGEDGGTYTIRLRNGSSVIASKNSHDGDDATLTTIARLAHNNKINVQACWDGFGSSRVVLNNSTLAVQWLGGAFTRLPIGPKANAPAR